MTPGSIARWPFSAWLITVLPAAILWYLRLELGRQYLGVTPITITLASGVLIFTAHTVYVLLLTCRSRPLGGRYALVTAIVYAILSVLYVNEIHALQFLVADVLSSNRSVHLLTFVGPTIAHCIWLGRHCSPPAIHFTFRQRFSFARAKSSRRWFGFTLSSGLKLARISAFACCLLFVDYRLILNLAFGDFGHWLFAVALLNGMLMFWPNPQNRSLQMAFFSLRLFSFLALVFAIVASWEMLPHNMFVVSATGLGFLMFAFPLWWLAETFDLIRGYQMLKATFHSYKAQACVFRGVALALVVNSPYQVHLEASAHKIVSFCLSAAYVLRALV